MPSVAALERGTEAGRQIVEAHRKANAGAYPETVRLSSTETSTPGRRRGR